MKKGDVIWGLLLVLILAFLLMPVTNRAFITATNASPYLMGFIKFAILATMGEFLTIRIIEGFWKAPKAFIVKSIIWGIIGIIIALMFKVFQIGVTGVVNDNSYFSINTWFVRATIAFLSSFTMNLTFGPVFMAAHRISDTYIELKYQGKKLRIAEVIERVDWSVFIKFIVFKTIPFFWIPMHTIAFLLPSDYKVLFAAFLSIALGALLSYSRRKKLLVNA